MRAAQSSVQPLGPHWLAAHDPQPRGPVQGERWLCRRPAARPGDRQTPGALGTRVSADVAAWPRGRTLIPLKTPPRRRSAPAPALREFAGQLVRGHLLRTFANRPDRTPGSLRPLRSTRRCSFSVSGSLGNYSSSSEECGSGEAAFRSVFVSLQAQNSVRQNRRRCLRGAHGARAGVQDPKRVLEASVSPGAETDFDLFPERLHSAHDGLCAPPWGRGAAETPRLPDGCRLWRRLAHCVKSPTRVCEGLAFPRALPNRNFSFRARYLAGFYVCAGNSCVRVSRKVIFIVLAITAEKGWWPAQLPAPHTAVAIAQGSAGTARPSLSGT